MISGNSPTFLCLWWTIVLRTGGFSARVRSLTKVAQTRSDVVTLRDGRWSCGFERVSLTLALSPHPRVERMDGLVRR